ncbi:MAG TPA: ACP S-malonyltransferase [Acidimicrobiia bacterium]|nr:ACP S-malonyltransferase [Acidimicrobiia bacterium]
MTYAILFPGQGSQTVGMGADLFDEHHGLLVDRADPLLGWSLRSMCLDGPIEELTRTQHAQPALFAVSYALWLSFKEMAPRLPAAAAGHSLGEYTALAASGALSFEDGLRLVAERGMHMAAAAELEPSGMAALIGADEDLARSVVAARLALGGKLQIANLNAPGQVVLAGGRDDLEWLEVNGGNLGVRRVIRLQVAGAFHSTFMEPAAGQLSSVIDQIAFAPPDFDVVSNVSAAVHELESMAEDLVHQVTAPVRFEQSLAAMSASGIDSYVHIGPGDVTAGLAKRTIPGADVYTVSSLEDVASVAESLSTMGD